MDKKPQTYRKGQNSKRCPFIKGIVRDEIIRYRYRDNRVQCEIRLYSLEAVRYLVDKRSKSENACEWREFFHQTF